LPTRRGFSLNQTWAALAAAAVVVPVTLVMAWYGWQSYNTQLNYALQVERQGNELLKISLESEVSRLKSLFINQGETLSLFVDQANEPVGLGHIYTLLRNMLEQEPAIHEIILLSPNSKILAFVEAHDLTRPGKHSEAELQTISEEWGFDVGEEQARIVIPLQGRNYLGSPKIHDGLTVITMSSPVGKNIDAVLIALVDASKLWTAGSPEHGIGTSKTRDYILDAHGVLIHDIPGSSYKAGDLMTHLGITRAALIEQDWRADQSYIGITNQLVYGTKTHIPVLGWTLTSEVIGAEITRPIWQFLFQIFAFSLIVISFFVWGVVYLARRTLSPLAEASRAIDRIAGGDLSMELKPSGIRELNAMVLGFNNMVKSRRHTENILRKREQYLAITLNSIGDAVITTNIRGKITNMNPVAETLTGWSKNNCTGLPLADVVLFSNAKTQTPILDPLRPVLERGETIALTNDTMLTARDGSTRHIANSAAPIIDEHGSIRGAVLVISNVSEKYKLSQEIDKQLVRFKELANLALTLTGAPQDIFDTISELIARLLGVQVVCISEVQGHEQIFLSVFASGKLSPQTGDRNGLPDTPCGVVVRDGKLQIFDGVSDQFPKAAVMQKHGAQAYCGCPALDSEGNVVAVVYLLQNKPHTFSDDDQSLLRIFSQRIGLEIEHARFLRRLKEQEGQLRQSQKMDAVGQLTGGLAHDFNNLLAIIQGNLSFLEEDLSDGRPISTEDLRESVQASLSAGRRGAELTHRLLSFSRQQALQPEVLNVSGVVQGMEDLLERTLGEDIEIRWHLSAGDWLALADASQLENVLLNLVLNARDAMPGGGTLTIETIEASLDDAEANAQGDIASGDYMILAVSDSGVGMPADVLDRVFEPFFTTKDRDKGTGLGLSMVYGFAKQSQGHVAIYSEQEKGTTVKIYLPRAANNVGRLDAESVKPLVEGGDETILIVEDDPEVRRITKRILMRQGYTVLESENGLEALELLGKANAIDLLLSDIVLPGGISGPEIAKKVRGKLPNLKILFMSGYTENAVVHHGYLDEGVDLINKPFTFKTLGSKVRDVLDA